MIKSKFLALFVCTLIPFQSFGAVMQMPLADDSKSYSTDYLFLKKAPAVMEAFKIPVEIQKPAVQQQSVSVNTYAGPYLKAQYVRPTVENIKQIVDKYKSIPGGITLEGPALGIPAINHIQYIPEKNAFMLNKTLIWENSLSPAEMKEIFNAMEKDDLMGVSLGEKDLIYGGLPEGSLASIFLKLSDHFLGCIAFACQEWIRYSTFPEGFVPKSDAQTAGIYAVYFNFRQFEFQISNNMVTPKNANMDITMIPLLESENKTEFLPDYNRIAAGHFSSAFEENSTHIAKNADYYSKDSRLQKVLAYGQLTALARALKASGIKLSTLL